MLHSFTGNVQKLAQVHGMRDDVHELNCTCERNLIKLGDLPHDDFRLLCPSLRHQPPGRLGHKPSKVTRRNNKWRFPFCWKSFHIKIGNNTQSDRWKNKLMNKLTQLKYSPKIRNEEKKKEDHEQMKVKQITQHPGNKGHQHDA